MGIKRELWTIGHSNRSIEAYIETLNIVGMQSVVDVRSQPFSKYTTHFNQAQIKESLSRARIQYIFMGDRLGGRPPEPEMYDDAGHVNYRMLSESARFQEGISELLRTVSQSRVAIMCTEENPIDCHRRLLIARVLNGDATIIHIRSDGSTVDEDSFAAQFDKARPQKLFDDGEGEEWRSIRPVSRGILPSNSSSH